LVIDIRNIVDSSNRGLSVAAPQVKARVDTGEPVDGVSSGT
jgi:hypothetical protein